MATRYAAQTPVPVDRSRTEIEHLLKRYGGTAFGYLSQGDDQIVVFEIGNRRVLMRLVLPDRNDKEFTHVPSGRQRRSASEAEKAYQQAVRARWRSLVLIIKAKLEAVAAGITTVEREFALDVVLPDGRTVGDLVLPQIQASYDTGTMPPMLSITGATG